MIEDVVMTDLTKEEPTDKELIIYQDYKKALINIDKAINLKDTKTLYLQFRQMNKFRKGFKDQDFSFIADNLLRHKYPLKSIVNLDGTAKVYIILTK